MLPRLRQKIREEGADLVFIQEALGAPHPMDARQISILTSQYEYLADGIWRDHAYGKNAVTEHTHHGNAILSRFPVRASRNVDISTNAFEKRGLLITEIHIDMWQLDCVCLCTHLDLTARGRRRQFAFIRDYIESQISPEKAIVLAGDFNDWNTEAQRRLAEPLGLSEVFVQHSGRLARTFPALFPLLPLDRIYVRGLGVRSAVCRTDVEWRRLSDHIAIAAELGLP